MFNFIRRIFRKKQPIFTLLDLYDLVKIALGELYPGTYFIFRNSYENTIGVCDSKTGKLITILRPNGLRNHLYSVCSFVSYLEKQLKEKL